LAGDLLFAAVALIWQPTLDFTETVKTGGDLHDGPPSRSTVADRQDLRRFERIVGVAHRPPTGCIRSAEGVRHESRKQGALDRSACVDAWGENLSDRVNDRHFVVDRRRDGEKVGLGNGHGDLRAWATLPFALFSPPPS